MINFILPSLFLILAVIVNKNSLAAEIGIVSGFWITLTQILSSNIRIISISSKDILRLRTTLLYRFGISIISIFIFYYFSSNLYNFENTNILNSICFLILMKWTNEMLLAQSEIKNKFRSFLLYLSINIVFIFIILLCFLYSNFDLLEITINFLSGFLFLNIIRSIYENSKFISFSKIIENVVYNLTSSAFTSSLGMISSSFLWRLFIFNYFSKSISGLIFACLFNRIFPWNII